MLLRISPVMLSFCHFSEVNGAPMLGFVQLFLTVFISDTLTNCL